MPILSCMALQRAVFVTGMMSDRSVKALHYCQLIKNQHIISMIRLRNQIRPYPMI